MSDLPATLFARFGGPEGVYSIVVDMYQRIQEDTDLAPFFANTSMDHLIRMQTEFLASALDGPLSYTGTELTAIHRGRGITGHHFARFCNHFAEAAQAKGVSERDIDSALGRLALYKDKITGDTNIDG